MTIPTVGNRAAETSTTTGTGTYSLDGAISGFQTIVAACGTGTTVHYYAKDQTTSDWEVGEGVITDATPDTLTRDTIFDSSNSGAAVNWSAGTRNIVVTFSKDAFDRLLNDDHIGVTVQAWNDNLDDLAALTTTKGNLLVSDGTDWTALPVGSNDQVLVADSGESAGIKWGGSSTGKLVLIETWTPTAVNSKDFTWPESLYSKIIVIGEGIVPATNDRLLYARFGYTNGGSFWTSSGDYDNAVWHDTGIATPGNTDLIPLSYDATGTVDGVGNATNEGVAFELNIVNMGSVSSPAYHGLTSRIDGNSAAQYIKGYVRSSGNACDSLRLYWSSSANFSATGKVYIYGVTKA